MDIKNLRKQKGLIGVEMANLCGISQQHYNYIENGKRRPSVQVAKRIADALGFDWTKFFEEHDSELEE